MNKKTQKARAQQKRRQKSAAKSKLRRKPAPGPAKFDNSKFPDKDYVFWLAHGANYLHSDYESGTWDPLFPRLYEGHAYQPEEIAKKIHDKFCPSEDKQDWPILGEILLGWTLTERAGVYAWYDKSLKAQKKVEADGPEALLKPHNVTVWEQFQFLKAQLTKKREKERAEAVRKKRKGERGVIRWYGSKSGISGA